MNIVKIKLCLFTILLFIISNSLNVYATLKNDYTANLEIRVGSNEVIFEENGKTNVISYDGEAIFIDDNGRTQIPLRYVKEILQEPELLVDWDEDTKTAELYHKERINKDIVAEVKIGSNIIKTAWGNEKMDSSPTIKNDRVFVPLRYILNSLLIDDSSLQWDSQSNSIKIIKESYSEEELNKAFKFLENNMKELEITGCGVIWRRNCIELSAYEWTEEKKDKIKELTGINRIVFEIDNNMDTDL